HEVDAHGGEHGADADTDQDQTVSVYPVLHGQQVDQCGGEQATCDGSQVDAKGPRTDQEDGGDGSGGGSGGEADDVGAAPGVSGKALDDGSGDAQGRAHHNGRQGAWQASKSDEAHGMGLAVVE